MPNGLRNWSYKDLTKFLKKKGFELDHQIYVSHEIWKGMIDDKIRLVNVNRTHKSYPVPTLEIMISQSGIIKKEWRNR